MKIYIVYRKDTVGYDEYDAHVVIAENPQRAKAMCHWGDGVPRANQIKVEEVVPGDEEKFVLSSFNAA